MTQRLKGAVAPVMTPFLPGLAPDTPRFVAHCRWLVANGAGLAIFGTNSEAASLSVRERLALTDALLEAGVPAAKMLPGTGACAITEAVELTRHAVAAGAAGVLMVPPFYYKGVSDQGLFDYYAHVIDTVASDALRVYLYHIPQVTQVPITVGLVEKLRARYPNTVAGAKDSSGNWDNTRALLENFAADGFDVFPASESLLSQALPLGAAGCISATVNLNPAGIVALCQEWNTAEGPQLQARADVIRKIFQSANMVPVMKRVAAHISGHADWALVRPPLVRQPDDAAADTWRQLQAAGFSMPGFAQAMA